MTKKFNLVADMRTVGSHQQCLDYATQSCDRQTELCVQMAPQEMSVNGSVGKIVFSTATQSPNKAINDDEAARLVEAQAAKAGLSMTPASSPSAAALPCEFFFTASEAEKSASPTGRASRHGGAPLTVDSIYQGNDVGGIKHVHTLSPGLGVAGLFYISSVQQVVCLGDDNSILTLADDGDAWKVLLYPRHACGC